MEQLPGEWVDRIFERLESIYQERWNVMFPTDQKKRLGKVQWAIALSGLTANQIKYAIDLIKVANNPYPPHVIEFYDYAKGKRIPYPCQPKNHPKDCST